MSAISFTRTIQSSSAEDDWMVLVNEIADMTVFTDTKSWYNGSNIEEKAKSFLPFIGVPVYTEMLDEIVSESSLKLFRPTFLCKPALQ